MDKVNGAQTVRVIQGRHAVFSAGNGKTKIDELKWLTETVLSESSAWRASGWAYIADCTQMKPVSPAEGGQLVAMTRAFVDSGCKAIAFVDGNSVMLKIQAQKNTERSATGIPEGHFATLDDALAWLKEEVNI